MLYKLVNKILNFILINVTHLRKPINILIIILVSLFILFIWSKSTTNKNEQSNYIADGMLMAFVNGTYMNFKEIDKNQSYCYKNIVWNDNNQHLKFKDIFDDDELIKSNGNNIFFHMTDCFNDGIPLLNPR